MNANESPVIRKDGYHDLYFRIIVALLAAHLIITFGEKESLFELLVMPAYYWSLAPSFAIAFLLVSFVNLVTIRLDRRYDWKQRAVLRAGLQLCFGLLLPALLAFLLAAVYFLCFGYHILDTLYLKYDFPVIVLMLVLLNAYYLEFYFYRQWRISENKMSLPASGSGSTVTNGKEVFMVQRGANTIPLPVTAIAYFYREGDYNFLRTFDTESYLVSQTLDEVESQLDAKLFFRANRQLIVQHKACSRFSPLEFGKLELFVNPPSKEPIVISQRRAKSFREWMQR